MSVIDLRSTRQVPCVLIADRDDGETDVMHGTVPQQFRDGHVVTLDFQHRDGKAVKSSTSTSRE